MSLVPWRRRDVVNKDWDLFPNWFDRWFDLRLQNRLPEVFSDGNIPPVNIAEDESSFQVSVELPGMNEKDITVNLMGNQLVIAGERRFEEEKKDREYHRIESQYGSFSRTVTLPRGVRESGVKATYKKGILTVQVPKVEPTPTAKIEVKAG